MLLAVVAVIWLLHGFNARLLLLLPGVIALPVYSLIPALMGRAIPLSSPTEEAKSANRGAAMWLVSIASMILSGIATFAWTNNMFWPFILGETVLVGGIYALMRISLERMRWQSAE